MATRFDPAPPLSPEFAVKYSITPWRSHVATQTTRAHCDIEAECSADMNIEKRRLFVRGSECGSLSRAAAGEVDSSHTTRSRIP